MEHGIITSTRYESGVVLCNVQAIRVSTEYEDIPMLKPFDGFHSVPKIGQKATITTLSDGTKFITDVIARNEKDHYPAEMEAGEIAIQLDEDTKLVFSKNANEGYDLEIATSGHLQFRSKSVDFDTTV